LQQKGVNEIKIFAKWDRRSNGLSLFIPSIFLCLIITYIQCEISLEWEEYKRKILSQYSYLNLFFNIIFGLSF
jgi:hypothetical protein